MSSNAFVVVIIIIIPSMTARIISPIIARIISFLLPDYARIISFTIFRIYKVFSEMFLA